MQQQILQLKIGQRSHSTHCWLYSSDSKHPQCYLRIEGKGGNLKKNEIYQTNCIFFKLSHSPLFWDKEASSLIWLSLLSISTELIGQNGLFLSAIGNNVKCFEIMMDISNIPSENKIKPRFLKFYQHLGVVPTYPYFLLEYSAYGN